MPPSTSLTAPALDQWCRRPDWIRNSRFAGFSVSFRREASSRQPPSRPCTLRGMVHWRVLSAQRPPQPARSRRRGGRAGLPLLQGRADRDAARPQLRPDRVVELGQYPTATPRLADATAHPPSPALDAVRHDSRHAQRSARSVPISWACCRNEMKRIAGVTGLLGEVGQRSGCRTPAMRHRRRRHPRRPRAMGRRTGEAQQWEEQPPARCGRCCRRMNSAWRRRPCPASAPSRACRRRRHGRARLAAPLRRRCRTGGPRAAVAFPTRSCSYIATWSLQRRRAYRRRLPHGPARLDGQRRPAMQEQLATEAARLQAVFGRGAACCTERHARYGAPPSSACRRFFNESGADGIAEGFFHFNIDPVTTKRTEERGEVGVVDLDPSRYPDGDHPIFAAPWRRMGRRRCRSRLCRWRTSASSRRWRRHWPWAVISPTAGRRAFTRATAAPAASSSSRRGPGGFPRR